MKMARGVVNKEGISAKGERTNKRKGKRSREADKNNMVG